MKDKYKKKEQLIKELSELRQQIKELKSFETEHKQAVEEVKALNKKIEFILSATKTGLDIIDSQFNIRYIDEGWKKIYGDPTGKKCYDYESWEKDFKATGTMRGIGWVVLYQDIINGKLINFWINEHDVSHPVGCNPMLIMDVFEHAFMLDYGLKRVDYIEAFFKNINWKAAEARLK